MFKRNKRSYSYSAYGYGRKRGLRIKWNRIIPAGIAVLAILVIVVVFNLSRIRLAFKGYSFSQQSEILEFTSDKINMILSYDKLDHIKDWISHGTKVKYYDDYEKYIKIHQDLSPKDVVKTVDNIMANYMSGLKELGYSENNVWDVVKTASIEDLEYLISKQYSYSTIKPYMSVYGFKFKDMEQYIKAYASSQNYSYAVLTTTYPFIIDVSKIKSSYTIQNPAEYLTLVKKGLLLPSTYEPKDLVTPDKKYTAYKMNKDQPSDYQLRKEAYEAYTQLYNDANKEGYTILLNSAYRSYKTQQKLYQEILNKYGGLYAKEHVAQPGTSEHQTGLGVDFTSQSVVDKKRLVFGDTKEYQWVVKNCYKYGFILRYREGTSKITGISHEPWHFRYVGKQAAKIIHEKGYTLEEYCLYYNKLPKIKENK